MSEERRNNYGFPTMHCDFCEKLITNNDSLVIDNALQYHGECYQELNKKFPKVLTEGRDHNLVA